MKYKHFSIEEREFIQYGLWQKRSAREIAHELDRSPSSVSREVNGNSGFLRGRMYISRRAHERALKKRKSRGRQDRLKNDIVRGYVIK